MATQYKQIVCLFALLLVCLLDSSCSLFRKRNTDVNLTQDVTQQHKRPPYFLEDSCFPTSHIGYVLMDAITGETVDAYQSDKYFTPASITKLATAYVALKYIGDTIVRFDYKLNKDSLRIRPYGDPTWYDTAFEQSFTFFDDIVYRRGNTNMILQLPKTLPSAYTGGWSWEDIRFDFFKANSLLSLNGNRAIIFFNNNEANIYPKSLEPYLPISNHLNDKSILPQLNHLYRDYFSNQLYHQTDTFLEHFIMPFSLFPKPQDLTNILSEYTNQQFTLERVDNEQYVDSTWSRLKVIPTIEALRTMLVESDNYIAQQLLTQVRTIQKMPYEGDSLYSLLINTDWEDLPQAFRWVDGSGLSRYNNNTPQNMVYILRKIIDVAGIDKLMSILPTIGEGTLKYWGDVGLEQKLFAKTGSMSGIFCLAGLLITEKQHPLLFAVMINGNSVGNYYCLQRAIRDWYLKF